MLSMNMSELLTAPWWPLAILLIPVTAPWVVLLRRLKRQRQELAVLQQRLEAMGGEMQALCAGSMGVDQRLSSLERLTRGLEQRQESLENQQDDDQPYGEAIQLVHQGASAGRLVKELGLSHSEAELVVMLHGVDKAS